MAAGAQGAAGGDILAAYRMFMETSELRLVTRDGEVPLCCTCRTWAVEGHHKTRHNRNMETWRHARTTSDFNKCYYDPAFD